MGPNGGNDGGPLGPDGGRKNGENGLDDQGPVIYTDSRRVDGDLRIYGSTKVDSKHL